MSETTADEIESAAEEVFAELGGEWSESIYHKAMIRELSERQLPHYTEGSLSVLYKGGSVGTRRPDLFIESEDGSIVVELKSGNGRGGESQLKQYLEMGEVSSDLNDIGGGMLITFGAEALSVERYAFD